MSTLATSVQDVSMGILAHLCQRINVTPAQHEPFSHIYLEDVFPREIYEQLLECLPASSQFVDGTERHNDGDGESVAATLALTPANLERLSAEQQELLRGVAAALTAPALKRAMFAKLARGLAIRYDLPASQVPLLPGHARPLLYREMASSDIAPQSDSRHALVTMQVHLPADRSQLDFGTALYRRRYLAWPFGHWTHRFRKVKQFPFRPNSGYAFVANHTIAKKSWHGRAARFSACHTLLNTFYDAPSDGDGGELN